EAEAADEVLLVVAVEDDGVDEADVGESGVEVETDGEGEPLAIAGVGAVDAVDLDCRADGAGLLDGDGSNGAREALSVIERTDESRLAGDDAVLHGEGVEKDGSALRDAALETAGVDGDGFRGVGEFDGGRRDGARARRDGDGRGVGDDCEGGELDGAVGPK